MLMPNYFVDEQRVGPYAIWHHEHHFKEGRWRRILDRVNYKVPLAFLESWLNSNRQTKT